MPRPIPQFPAVGLPLRTRVGPALALTPRRSHWHLRQTECVQLLWVGVVELAITFCHDSMAASTTPRARFALPLKRPLNPSVSLVGVPRLTQLMMAPQVAMLQTLECHPFPAQARICLSLLQHDESLLKGQSGQKSHRRHRKELALSL